MILYASTDCTGGTGISFLALDAILEPCERLVGVGLRRAVKMWYLFHVFWFGHDWYETYMTVRSDATESGLQAQNVTM